ncbi:hypothetical protein ACLQ28_26545 [Micromonospora sp. DT201]|uniref:hypothetical protein n=1 Tax=Micromonospora sp. DT201 TaxID=3393442 RepID=UPI003CF5F8DE
MPAPAERQGHRAGVLPAVIGGVFAIVAALIAGVFTLFPPPENASAPKVDTASPSAGLPAGPGVGTVSASPTPSDPGGTPSSSADKVRWAHPVRLTFVDLDSVPAQVLSGNDKASVWVNYGTSENVLYGLNGGFFTTKPSIAAWEEVPRPTREQCADLISTQGTETLPIADDSRFCVRTAADRVAYLAIKKFDRASGTYLADVTVWETPEG